MSYNENKKKHLSAGSILIAFSIILIMVCSYLIRELNPDKALIHWLLGGSRILIFWAISGFLIYKFDLERLKKKKEINNGLINSKDTLFSFKVLGVGLAIAILVIIAIELWN